MTGTDRCVRLNKNLLRKGKHIAVGMSWTYEESPSKQTGLATPNRQVHEVCDIVLGRLPMGGLQIRFMITKQIQANNYLRTGTTLNSLRNGSYWNYVFVFV